MTETEHYKVVGFFSPNIIVDQVVENVLSSALDEHQIEVLTEKSMMIVEDTTVDEAAVREEDLRRSCIIITVQMIDHYQEVQGVLLGSGAFKVVIQPDGQANIFSHHRAAGLAETIMVNNDDHGPYIPFLPVGTHR